MIQDHPGRPIEVDDPMRRAFENSGKMEPALIKVDGHGIYLTALGRRVLKARQ
jgi:hypothetical protein